MPQATVLANLWCFKHNANLPQAMHTAKTKLLEDMNNSYAIHSREQDKQDDYAFDQLPPAFADS